MTHIYLSGPIIHAELRKDDFYRAVVDYLESRNISVFAPQFLGPADPVEIYLRDVEHVRKCHILIAEVSNPSLGVGMELGIAREIETPIIMFRNTSSKPLSKMVLGSDKKALFEYTSVSEVIDILKRIDLEKVGYYEACPECKTDLAEYLDGKKERRCVKCGTEH